jgi:hypothetical protein
MLGERVGDRLVLIAAYGDLAGIIGPRRDRHGHGQRGQHCEQAQHE